MNEDDSPAPWPEEGGRPFARGYWANIGPFNYRGNRALAIATRATAVLVLAGLLAVLAFGSWIVANEWLDGSDAEGCSWVDRNVRSSLEAVPLGEIVRSGEGDPVSCDESDPIVAVRSWRNFDHHAAEFGRASARARQLGWVVGHEHRTEVIGDAVLKRCYIHRNPALARRELILTRYDDRFETAMVQQWRDGGRPCSR